MEESLTLEQASERLMEDESLRTELMDDEAQVLLDWALAEIAAAEQRGEPLAPAVARTRAIGRQVNDLIGARGELSQRAFAARLRTLAGVPDPGSNRFWRHWWGRGDAIDALLDRLPGLDGPDLVRAVLALVSSPPREASA